ncbi:MAG: hypothetical protein A2Y55_04910 [Actinobacteria bacterium RBG_16_68_12]|nr:MAG: hypothetical protein A2Y55_04910 [Actinobacteria bacterium RBG_16_68_12]
MKVRFAILVALAAAVTMAAVAAAGPDAAKLRVAITMKDLPNGAFVLEPLQAGALKRDSGTTSVVYKRLNVVMREGQRVEIYRLTFTLEGKHGSLTTRERNEWVDTGGPFVGMGTWKVVRGTGQYAQITGGGRTAHAGLDRGNGVWYVREEGFLSVP